MNYTEIEAKVREATNDEAWGPTGMHKNGYTVFLMKYFHFCVAKCSDYLTSLFCSFARPIDARNRASYFYL